jgi:universal stress protein E
MAVSTLQILVALDPTRFVQPALEKAEAIAKLSSARLQLYCCSAGEAERAPEYFAEVERWVERLALAVRAEDIAADTKVEWSREWRMAIVAAAAACGANLLVKTASPASSARRALLASADVEVLRHCECPVLLVKTHSAWRGGTVLAAVQVAPEDEAHENVRDAVLKSARDIAAQLGFELHIVTVDPQRVGWFDRTGFAQRCHVPHQRVHVKRGNPVEAISELAAELAADLVVLGTVARQDQNAARVGSTAEKLAYAVQADVLAIPPTTRGPIVP